MSAQNHRWGVGPIQTCKSGPRVTVLHEKRTQMRAGTHLDLTFWCKSRCFACIKRQVMSWTHRDLLFRSKVADLHEKNHRWGQAPIETSNSDARHHVLHAENHRWGLGPIERCNFGPKVAALNTQNTDEGWNPYSLFTLVLSTLLWVLKTTDEVWDQYRLVSLVLESLFCMKKEHRWGLEPT